MKEYLISHLVKSEDLNHHGTLFAGRSAEWLVEAGFIAAATEHGRPQDILCINIHGFVFKKPVNKGTILTLHSRIAKVGRSSITVYVKAYDEIEHYQNVDGFITFVCVDQDTGKSKSHGIVLNETQDQEEIVIRKKSLLIEK